MPCQPSADPGDGPNPRAHQQRVGSEQGVAAKDNEFEELRHHGTAAHGADIGSADQAVGEEERRRDGTADTQIA